MTPDEHLLVTVDGPSGRRDLRLPTDAQLRDLLPSVIEVCEGRTDGASWSLRVRGERTLTGDETLAGAGIFRGAILELIAPAEEARSVSKPSIADRVRVALVTREREPRIDSLSDSAYLRMLDQAIAGRQISHSMVVAVMARHACAGRTTIATLLATLLGEMRTDSVALCDADPDSAALSHWLAPDAPRPALDGELDPRGVMGAMVAAGNRISVLPAPSGQVNWSSLIEHLRRLHRIVVLDCAAGFRKPSSAAALAAADLVVMVTRPVHHASSPPRDKTVVVVENQAPRRVRPAQLRSGVMVVKMVDEPGAAHRLKTRGFTWSQAPASWQVSIRELAALLVGSAS